MYLENSITKAEMKNPVSKFEEEMQRIEVTGLKKKIKKSADENIRNLRKKAVQKKQVLQKQITLVLLVFTMIWFLMLIMIWFG